MLALTDIPNNCPFFASIVIFFGLGKKKQPCGLLWGWIFANILATFFVSLGTFEVFHWIIIVRTQRDKNAKDKGIRCIIICLFLVAIMVKITA